MQQHLHRIAGAHLRRSREVGVEADREPAAAEDESRRYDERAHPTGEHEIAVPDQQQAAEEERFDVRAGMEDVAG